MSYATIGILAVIFILFAPIRYVPKRYRRLYMAGCIFPFFLIFSAPTVLWVLWGVLLVIGVLEFVKTGRENKAQ